MTYRNMPLVSLAFVLLIPTPLAGQDLETGIHELAQALSEPLKNRGVEKLAVVEFTDLRGYASALDYFIAEEMTTQLFVISPGEFSVVERRQLDRVRQEQKLTSSEFFDQESLANVGKVLGLDAVITGTIADMGKSLRINARAIAVETAEVFAAASTTLLKDEAIESLLRQGAAPSDDYGGSSTRPVGRQVQASDVFFQNKDIRLTVDSVSIDDERRDGVLALRLENLTVSDLFLALEQPYKCKASLIDNRGVHSSNSNTGVTGIACIGFNSAARQPAEAFTMISAKSSTTLVFSFHFIDEVKGDRFSFSANFLIRRSGSVSRFSAGISNIQAH